MATLHLFRGKPGSGKSSAARRMFPGLLHVENDMFLIDDGKYKWSPSRVKTAMRLCSLVVKTALANGCDVVVANTFTKKKFIDYYKNLASIYGAAFKVYRCVGEFKNVHGLDDKMVENFAKSMEDYPGEIVIDPDDNFFWGEVSGPIEHYFKKHNGRPVPKELAGKFLRTNSTIVPSNDPNDLVHYTRKIADLENPVEKAIYGFKDEAMAKEVMESIDNYEAFRLNVNSLPDRLNEDIDNSKNLENALDVVIKIAEMHEEFKFNEMLPHWKKNLDKAISYMKEKLPYIDDTSLRRQVASSIETGNILNEEMPLLKIKKFVVN